MGGVSMTNFVEGSYQEAAEQRAAWRADDRLAARVTPSDPLMAALAAVNDAARALIRAQESIGPLARATRTVRPTRDILALQGQSTNAASALLGMRTILQTLTRDD